MFLLRRVEGLSMSPTFPQGKIILASKLRRPKVGDVVIVRHHRLEIIKRINKMQGDKVYVLGDNPKASTDSRHYGWLPINSILGVVMGHGAATIKA